MYHKSSHACLRTGFYVSYNFSFSGIAVWYLEQGSMAVSRSELEDTFQVISRVAAEPWVLSVCLASNHTSDAEHCSPGQWRHSLDCRAWGSCRNGPVGAGGFSVR